MCLIVTEKNKNKSMFTLEDFDSAWEKNSDGAGIMWTDRNAKVHTFKALHKNKVKTQYEKLKGKVDNLTIHFRFGTSGTKGIENVHPFKILDVETDGIDLYMMHNGVIKTLEVNNKYCDTWHFAENYLKPILKSDFHLLFNPNISDLIESKIGYSKLTFLYSNSEYEGVHIINENSGDWLGDTTWVSNKGYVKYVPVHYSNYNNHSWTNKLEDEPEDSVDETRLYSFHDLPKGSCSYVRCGNRRYVDGTMYYYHSKLQSWVKREGIYDEEGYPIPDNSFNNIFNINNTPKLPEVENKKEEDTCDIKEPQKDSTLPAPLPPEQLPLFEVALEDYVTDDYHMDMSIFLETLGYANTFEEVMQVINTKKYKKLVGALICELMLYKQGKFLNDIYELFMDNAFDLEAYDDFPEIIGGMQ